MIDIKEPKVTEKRISAKSHMTLGEKIKRRIYITRIVFSIISMLLYTAFTVVMLNRNWGNTVYNSIILGFVGLYVLLFLLIIIFTQIMRRGGQKLTRSFKDYKSGLKIMNSLLRLISFGLTVSIFAASAAAGSISTPFQTAVLVISIIWAFFQIVFQIKMIRKRHRAAKNLKKAKEK